MGVIGSDGGDALTAKDGSTIVLDQIKVEAGKGGDGLVPGKDGIPFIVDDTSKILWKSGIQKYGWYE